MIELKGITWDHPRGYQPLQASTQPYAERFGVHVRWEKRSLKDFGDAPIDVLADAYDLLIMDHPHVGLGFKTGCLLPLDSELSGGQLATLAEQSAGPSHSSYTFGEHQWALANDAAMQASAYRPDLMTEPFPQSWEEVVRLGEKTRQHGTTIAIPLCPTDAICAFITLCASLGSPPGADGHLVEAHVGREALNLLIAFARISHPASLDWNPIRMLDHMSQTDEVVYAPLSFCYTNYARQGYAPHLIRFHDIPGIRGSILGGAGIAVSARSAHPREAAAYAAWIASADIQRTLYLENGGQPGNRLVWEDDAANALTNNFFRDTLATLENAYLRPRHDGWAPFQEDAGIRINRMLRDGTSPDTCLAQLMENYQRSL